MSDTQLHCGLTESTRSVLSNYIVKYTDSEVTWMPLKTDRYGTADGRRQSISSDHAAWRRNLAVGLTACG